VARSSGSHAFVLSIIVGPLLQIAAIEAGNRNNGTAEKLRAVKGSVKQWDGRAFQCGMVISFCTIHTLQRRVTPLRSALVLRLQPCRIEAGKT
jgi:hypothetical protein